MENKHKEFYRRRLPHINPAGGSFFVTFRLYGSLPTAVIAKLISQYKIANAKNSKGPFSIEQQAQFSSVYVNKLDYSLDHLSNGPYYLKNHEVAQKVIDAIELYDGKKYEMVAYCIMPNHVHILLNTDFKELPNHLPFDQKCEPLYLIMKSIKGASGRWANQVLNRKGKFWARESWDVLIRSPQHYQNVIGYILENPVKAGFVEDWLDWEYSYLKPR